MSVKTWWWAVGIKSKLSRTKSRSVAVTDQGIIKKFTDDPDFPFLVSFPRTGSHWLRMIMELYFERPSLVRIFYYPDRKNYLCLHTHDLNLDVFRKNVIYLYRDPIPTIYSQMKYENENLNDIAKIKYWADLYKQHLKKWLIDEIVSQKKVILRYENMLKDFENEFLKLVLFFGQTLNPKKLAEVRARIDKREVKKKTTHDKQVVQLSAAYSIDRDKFSRRYGNMIEDIIFGNSPEIKEFF